jgi:hypothetical protein
LRFVFVTDELPRPNAAGHLALNHAIISWLQGLGHEVTVLFVGARLALPMERYGLAQVAGPKIKTFGAYLFANSPVTAAAMLARTAARRLPPELRKSFHGADAVLGGFTSQSDSLWCARYIARVQPDTVLIDTIFRAGLLSEPELNSVNSVIITHDVFHCRHMALASAGYSVQPQRLTREDEAAWLCGARHIAAIQPDDAKRLAAMCPTQNVFTAPMPAFPCPPLLGLGPLPGRLVFVGSAALPNLDGLRWFFAEVWPLLQGHGITLDLIGDCGAALRQLPAGVRRLGRVENLSPLLHRAALAIAPLRVGSGLKIKLLDYARHGLLTIATPPSLAGFAPDAASPFLIADSPRNFALSILRQLDAPPAPKRALDYIARHYGVAASFSELAKALAT